MQQISKQPAFELGQIVGLVSSGVLSDARRAARLAVPLNSLSAAAGSPRSPGGSLPIE